MEEFLRKIFVKFLKPLGIEAIRVLDHEIHRTYTRGAPNHSEYLHNAYWERQARLWDDCAPPMRPSLAEIEIYRIFFKQQTKKANILILGSTPELRDLVSEETDADIYVADFCYDMPAMMLKFTKNVDPRREKWIKNNWLDLPFPANFFDVILGDVVLHQVSPRFESAFLTKVRSLLRRDGFFITRFFFLNENFLQNDLGDITDKILNGAFASKQKLTLLKLQTVWLFADLKMRRFDRRRSAQKFNEMLAEKRLSDPILERAGATLAADKDSYRDWAPPEESDLLRIISPFFAVIERRNAADYPYAAHFPIFLLSPRYGGGNSKNFC